MAFDRKALYVLLYLSLSTSKSEYRKQTASVKTNDVLFSKFVIISLYFNYNTYFLFKKKLIINELKNKLRQKHHSNRYNNNNNHFHLKA